MSYFIFSWEEPWKQKAPHLHMHTMYVCVSDDIVFLRFVCLKKIIMSSVVVFDTNRWRV